MGWRAARSQYASGKIGANDLPGKAPPNVRTLRIYALKMSLVRSLAYDESGGLFGSDQGKGAHQSADDKRAEPAERRPAAQRRGL